MTTTEQANLRLELDMVEIDDIEVFLQEGSKGMGEFAASCSTICSWLCCTPSCACCVAESGETQPIICEQESQMDGVLSD